MGKKTKKTKNKVGLKGPQVVAPVVKTNPSGKPPKKIRMLISCANQNRSFAPGDIFQVPQEIPVDTARGWINVGTAEDISDCKTQKEKKIEGPFEMKIIEPEETKDEAPEEEAPSEEEELPETTEDPPEAENK